jgi:hypothetical protein
MGRHLQCRLAGRRRFTARKRSGSTDGSAAVQEPRVIRHRISESGGLKSPPSRRVAPSAPSRPPLPDWAPRLRPVLEEACGALVAASVLYALALMFGYVRGPSGATVLFVAGGVSAVAWSAFPALRETFGRSRLALIRRLGHMSAFTTAALTSSGLLVGEILLFAGFLRQSYLHPEESPMPPASRLLPLILGAVCIAIGHGALTVARIRMKERLAASRAARADSLRSAPGQGAGKGQLDT